MLRAIDGVHHVAGIGDPDEAELAVVCPGGVEVDRSHAQRASEWFSAGRWRNAAGGREVRGGRGPG